MILCCGETLIDMLPRKTINGEMAFQPYSGGSVFNTAVTLGRLGASVGMYTGLSTDMFGEQLAAFLEESNVSLDAVHRRDRPTTLAFVTLKDGHASYAFYDENTAGRMLSMDSLPELTDEVVALFFGGISLMVEPAATTYETFFLREAALRPVMIDPNIRPSFISDEPAYRARLNRLLDAASIVKVSDEDLAWIMGDSDLEDSAQALLDRGAHVVCVTEGSKGVRAFSQHGVTTASATRVDVVDTVGAGDTFNGGFLASLKAAGVLSHDGLDTLSEDILAEALRSAARAAAVTVSREGANPPWAHELS